MTIIYFWYLYIVIGSILIIGKSIVCRFLGIYHNHYQIGLSPGLFSFKLFSVNISIGIIIPLPFLFKIYEIHGSKKVKPKPIWFRREHSFFKRLMGILGGITLLYIFAILLYAVNFYTTEDTYLSANDLNKNGVYADSTGYELGFRTGDKILKIDDKPLVKYSDIVTEILTNGAKNFTIIRKDSILNIEIDNDIACESIIKNNNGFLYPIYYTYPITIDKVLKGGGAQLAGIKNGDQIITLNNDTVLHFFHLKNMLRESNKDSVILCIKRNGTTQQVLVNTSPYGKLGVSFKNSITHSVRKKTFLESLNSGNAFISTYLKQIKTMLYPEETYKNVGGFVAIGNIFPTPTPFWRILSVNLLIYLCIFIVPSPISDSRYIVALLIDKAVKLPYRAGAWIGWIIIVPTLFFATIEIL